MALESVGDFITHTLQGGGFTDNASLSVKPAFRERATDTGRGRRRGRRRPRVEREASDMSAFVVRVLGGLAKRAEGGDLESLVALRDLDVALTVAQKRAARGLVELQGYSWTQLAQRLGISRQGARQRWDWQ